MTEFNESESDFFRTGASVVSRRPAGIRPSESIESGQKAGWAAIAADIENSIP